MSRLFTYGLLFFVMFLWGFNVIAVKILVEQIPPVLMQGLRVGIAGIVVIIILIYLKDLRRLSKKEWIYIFFASFLGQLLHHGLLAIGLTQTTASNTSIILGLIPLTTAILAIIFLKERFTFLRFVGIVLGFSGVTVVILQNSGSFAVISKGDLFVFLSMVAQACSFIIIKKVAVTLSAKQMTALMLLMGSGLLLLTSYFVEPQTISQLEGQSLLMWTILLTSAILATGIGHIFYNLAINQIGAGPTAIFNNLVPFFTLLGAYFILGETIASTQIIGFFLIVLGVLFGTGYADNMLFKRKGKIKQRAS